METTLSTPTADCRATEAPAVTLPHRLDFEPVLIGRDVERSFLEDYLDAARDGQGRFLLVSGKAGIGKTRLVQNIVHAMNSKGEGRTIVGSCRFQKRMTPYFPFRQILDTLGNGRGKAVLSDKSDSWADTTPPHCPWNLHTEVSGLEDGDAYDRRNVVRQKLFFSMCQSLLGLAGNLPLLIILEDIQWADISSIQFLHILARNISGSKILIVATHDPEDPFSTGHGLNSILQKMARELLFEKLELRTLSREECKTLAIWYFPDAEFSEAFHDSLTAISQGNPYLVRTALEILLSEGVIIESGGVWSNTRKVENYFREPILALVRRRLDGMNSSLRMTLDYLAAMGDPVTPDLLSAVMAISPSVSGEALSELEVNNRLLHSVDGTYFQDHSLIAQSVYCILGIEQRRAMHRRIGETLEQLAGSESDERIYERAFHFALSDDREKALFCLEQAADEASHSLAFQEVLRFCKLGISIIDSSQSEGDADRLKMKFLLMSGEMNQVLGYWEASMEDYKRAATLGEAMQDEQIKGEAFMQIGLAYAKRGMWTEAESFYAQSIDIFERSDMNKHMGLVKTYDADIKLGRCEWKRAQVLYEEALNTAMRTMNRRLMARIYSNLGVIADIRGDLMGAMVNYSKSLNLFKDLEEYPGMANVYRQLGTMHANGQKWEKALEFYDKCIDLYDKVGEVGLLSLAYLNKAVANLNLLAVGKAEKLCDVAQRYLIQVEDKRSLAECNKVLGFIGVKRGEWHYSQRRFEESLRILESCGDTLGLAQNLSEIGSIFAHHEKTQKALEMFQRAHDLYKKLGIDNRVEELRIKIKNMSSSPERPDFRKKKST